MNFLDRDKYNQKIKELNTNLEMRDIATKELTALHDSLLCNSSDYEEIVMMTNICIANDRENDLEKLYENYYKLKQMLNDHGEYAIEDHDVILYCMGVFSFKFHDYKVAIEYLKKSEELISNKFSDPYSSIQSDIYVKTKILISYSLEYEGYLCDGPKNAIDNILDEPLNVTEEGEKQLIDMLKKKPREIVSGFFKQYPSKTYTYANELMKNEVLHVMAHCFSEYANKEKADKNNSKNYKKIFLWEKMAEGFIDALGEEMITCKAIISSEHGQYWSVLDNMKAQYRNLSEDEKKKKAELAFYIYYFSNQIGIDQSDEIKEYEEYFLDYAEHEKGDITVYAWIVQFRKRFAKALKSENGNVIQELLELESFIRKIKEQNTNQSYLHPQILREKNRLLLAYQIIRSYLALNEKKEDTNVDNSLFEKCILFSKHNSIDRLTMEKKVDCNDREQLIELHNVPLCVIGMTEEIHFTLQKEFCTKIPFYSDAGIYDHKVIICNTNEQLETLDKMKKSHLILFINCQDQYYSKIKEMVDENVCVETDIIKTFKIAYIQEILEQCYQFAYRWEEFYIMAPITDNSTFAFQNQGIDKFLEIKNMPLIDKELFSEDNGYATNEFGVLNRIQEVQYKFDEKEGGGITRIFYFSGDCLYFYKHEKSCFIPHKVLRDLDGIKEVAGRLQKNTRKINATKNKCDCHLETKHCLCDEWTSQNNDVHELLMRFSIDLPLQEEAYCTVVWSGSMDKVRCLQNFLLILSKDKIKSYSLREHLNCLSNISQNIQYGETSTVDKQDSNDVEQLRKLLDEVNKYESENKNRWPKESADYNQMLVLKKKIESSIRKRDIGEYENLQSEWMQIRNGY